MGNNPFDSKIFEISLRSRPFSGFGSCSSDCDVLGVSTGFGFLRVLMSTINRRGTTAVEVADVPDVAVGVGVLIGSIVGVETLVSAAAGPVDVSSATVGVADVPDVAEGVGVLIGSIVGAETLVSTAAVGGADVPDVAVGVRVLIGSIVGVET